MAGRDSEAPDGSVGIPQTVRLDRVEVLLWPMLVEPSSRLVLRDIPAESWTVVGLHLPNDAHIRGLVNGGPPRTGSLALADRSIELDDASVDSWNLYPQADARIAVTDCVLGEILSLERSRTHVSRSVIDGSGGFLAVDNGLVGTWTADLARADYRLRIQLTDDLGRRFTSWVAVPDPPTAAALR